MVHVLALIYDLITMKHRRMQRVLAVATLVILIVCLAWALGGCGRQNTALTDAEGAAITEICGADYNDFADITSDVLSKERRTKYPAISKVYHHDNLYAFIVEPVAYNGPVTLALVIDHDSGDSIGMRIVKHVETPHYVRDMESYWFIERFAGKSARDYLRLVRLTARHEQDVVAITGATVTTEGIINGVNAAFGTYQEFMLGLTGQDVPYMVRFEPGEGDGPVETGSLAIRAYGLILAEVSLEEIRALPPVKRTMSIHSTAGVTRHEFRGTLLSHVLNLVDPGLMEEYSWLMAVGVDDYISSIAMEEVLAENSVFVMYEDNGVPLLKRNGEPGAMRVIVVNDVFGQRFTNFLLEIVLESKEPF
jgi:Na+-translocating ferredoxin:NAD+ oxidoreductase RnfG subunit